MNSPGYLEYDDDYTIQNLDGLAKKCIFLRLVQRYGMKLGFYNVSYIKKAILYY